MNRTVLFLAASLFPSLLAANQRNSPWPEHGSPPTRGTTHIHARYGEGYVHAPYGAGGIGAVGSFAEEARALGRSKFNGGYRTARQGGSNSRPNLNPGSYRQEGPYYGFGSLNFGPFGTGLFGNGGNSGYGGGGFGGGGGYGRGGYGYGGNRSGMGGSRYGYGGYGGYGGLGGYGGYGYGRYGNSGALGFGDPHSRFYFGASPINDPSTYRYGGNSTVPQVPGFQNFAHPSGLVPYSYIYVNPRTPQDPPDPQRIANPFVNSDGDRDAPRPALP